MTLSRRHLLGAGLALTCCPYGARSATPPGDWLRRWLTAFNDAGAATYPAFVKQHAPSLLPYLDEDLGVREASGGFVLLGSEAEDREVTALVRDRNWDRLSSVTLSIGDDKLDDIAFAAPPAAAGGAAIPRLREADALRALDGKLRIEAAADRFSGTVLVAKGDRLLLREAYGAADAVGGRKVTADTRFCIGSAGKMFTAVAVLRLVQQGRLQLSDTIAMRVPGYPNTPLARSVTVRHLLSHTGGTGDFFGPEYDTHAAELLTPANFVQRFGAREPLFPPGSRWGYSNFGYILLGAMLEGVSGERWDTHLERAVLRPSGMTATSPRASPADTAVPLNGAAQTGLKPLPHYVGLPAGGGYSTITDLHRFAAALRSGTLLDPAHLRLLTTPHVAAGSANWSLGLRLAERNGAPTWGHRGSAPGVSADFACFPASDYTVVVLCNRGHPHAVNAADFIGSRLPLAETG